MNDKKSGIITVMAFLIVLLIANNVPTSFAYAENQNQAKTISITECGQQGSCFSLCQLVIVKGDTVTWTNQDKVIHMITSGSGQNGPDGWFSSHFIFPHGTFSYKFERTGAFSYYDVLHPHMEGVVIVGSTVNSSYVHLAESYFSNWCSR